jgi:hypothetical protein
MSEELVRCPSCRGRKQVEKLGGVLGDCNTCLGEGKIKLCDKPLPPLSQSEAVYGNKDVIEAVSRAVPCQIDPLEDDASRLQDELIVDVVEPVVVESKSVKKINTQGKRAVFKRKKED